MFHIICTLPIDLYSSFCYKYYKSSVIKNYLCQAWYSYSLISSYFYKFRYCIYFTSKLLVLLSHSFISVNNYIQLLCKTTEHIISQEIHPHNKFLFLETSKESLRPVISWLLRYATLTDIEPESFHLISYVPWLWMF